MNSLLSQVSYPVFLYMTLLFFLIASVFSFLVGIGLATRSKKAMRFFDLMNRWISVRRMMRPLSVPHYVEPALLKRRIILGTVIIIGAAISIRLLADTDLRPALRLFDGSLSAPEIAGVSENLRLFLIVGNVICLLVGVLLLFFPRMLAMLENFTDHWYSIRKRTLPLHRMHMEVDCWVLKHPTSTGITLSVLSFSDGLLMLNQIQGIVG